MGRREGWDGRIIWGMAGLRVWGTAVRVWGMAARFDPASKTIPGAPWGPVGGTSKSFNPPPFNTHPLVHAQGEEGFHFFL